MTGTKKIMEKDIQGAASDAASSLGCLVIKQVNHPRIGGTPGVLDLLLVPHDGAASWHVECKRPDTVGRYRKKLVAFLDGGHTQGCTRSEIRQFKMIRQLEDRSQPWAVVGTAEEIDILATCISKGIADVRITRGVEAP